MADELESLTERLRHEAVLRHEQGLRALEARLAPDPGHEPMPRPAVGVGPYEPAVVYGKGTVDSKALSPRAYFRGPNDMDIDVSYLAPGFPQTVQRHDGATLVADALITYAGTHVASIVILRESETITVTPLYTGDDITHIDRVVT